MGETTETTITRSQLLGDMEAVADKAWAKHQPAKVEVVSQAEVNAAFPMEKGLALPKQVRDVPWKAIAGGIGGLVLGEAINIKWPERIAQPDGTIKLNTTNLLVKGGAMVGAFTLGKKYLGKDVGLGMGIVLGVSIGATLFEVQIVSFINRVAGWFGYEGTPVTVFQNQGQNQNFANVRQQTALAPGPVPAQYMGQMVESDQLARIRG